MASFQWLVLAVCSMLIAVQGYYTVDMDALPGQVNVTDTVSGTTLSDGYAVINSGDITAMSLTVNDTIYAASGSFGELNSGSASAFDVAAMDTSAETLSTGELQARENSLITEDLTVVGLLNASLARMGDTEISSLTVVGDTEFQGIVFAQTNVQVSGDLSLDGNLRVFGDLLAGSDVTLGDSLTVNDWAQIETLNVENALSTSQLEAVNGTFGSLSVQGPTNVTGDFSVGGNATVWGDAAFAGDLNAAGDGSATSYMTGEDLSIAGMLTVAEQASFIGDVGIGGSLSSGTWLGAGGDTSVGGFLTVGEDLMVTGDITSAGALTGVDAMFTNLSVDTGSIETLTAGFITTTTLVATDASITNSWMSGSTTVDDLTVMGDASLQDVTSTMISAQDVMTDTATSGSLTVTGDSVIQDATVKISLTVGNPSETGYFASIEEGFADYLKANNLVGDVATITDLWGTSLSYDLLNATWFTTENLTATSAQITDSTIENAWINSVTSERSEITNIEANDTVTSTLMADRGQVTNVTSDTIQTTNFTSFDTANIDTFTLEWYRSENLTAVAGTVDSLESTAAWITHLTSYDATLTNLWGINATVLMLDGNNVWFDRAWINKLWNERGITGTLDATEYITTNWLWDRQLNATTHETVSLLVHDSAWLEEGWVRGDLDVQGNGVFESGFLAGYAVVTELDVVGATQLGTLSANEPAWFTELVVKRVTITDDFMAEVADFGNTTIETLETSGPTRIKGELEVVGDSALGGNLVVSGTTQFQTGSFTRIGTAIITTTDMEAFNMDVANGLFGSITTDDLTVVRNANFQRSILVFPQRNSPSGATSSWYSAIAPTALTADYDGDIYPVNTHTVLNSGFLSVDAMVVSDTTDPTKANIRFMGDGSVDLIDGDMIVDDFAIQGGILFENENNVAWVRSSATSNLTLAQGASGVFYSYEDLVDRDLVAPGSNWAVTRFHAPTDPSTDLITLSAGHYKVSGRVYFNLENPATANAVSVATAAVDAWWGNSSDANPPFWSVECVASFNVVSGSRWGGSCAFSDVLGVPQGQEVTLRTDATWAFSSSAPGSSLMVSASSTQLQISELFERTSEKM